jgi:ATP-independent RNA helicase DbpA
MPTNTDFASLMLAPALLENLRNLGYERMTPIQAAALPPMLDGKDVIAQAKTGSGKTAAFGLAVLMRLQASVTEIQALVICPTRELADQVGRELRALSRTMPNIKLLTLCGGVPLRVHRESLEHGAHIVVGTPGRLRALLDKQRMQLDGLSLLVLDEADRMLEMGFEEDLRAVMQRAPVTRQTLLFSATYPDGIAQISAGYQRNPVRVSVDTEIDASQLQQLFYEVGPGSEARAQAVLALIAEHGPISTLVFCNTKDDCDALARALRRGGVRTLALHGDLEQRERDEVLVVFANHSCSALVATDVAARGLDIVDLDCVINYEISPDAGVHVHRVGRTGRAGKQGLALSLYRASDSGRVARIEDAQGRAVTRAKLPAMKAGGAALVQPPMVTLLIEGGRKDKLRAGDILGALTGDGGVAGDQVGKIQVMEIRTYVAVKREAASRALGCLLDGRIKKRKFRVSKVAAG